MRPVALWCCLGNDGGMENLIVARHLGIRRHQLEKSPRNDSEGDGDPSARYGHSLTYDAARGVVISFGGGTGGDFFRLYDTWELKPAFGGFVVPLNQTVFSGVTLLGAEAIAVAKKRPTKSAGFNGRANLATCSPKASFTAKPTANSRCSPTPSPSQPSFASWPQVTANPSPPINCRSARPRRTFAQAIDLDYMELRLLYDLDQDNTKPNPPAATA